MRTLKKCLLAPPMSCRMGSTCFSDSGNLAAIQHLRGMYTGACSQHADVRCKNECGRASIYARAHLCGYECVRMAALFPHPPQPRAIQLPHSRMQPAPSLAYPFAKLPSLNRYNYVT